MPSSTRTEGQWLEQARSGVLRGDFATAEAVLDKALGEFPDSFELRRVLAGIYRRTARDDRAESLLRELLGERPQDAGSVFTLAQMLIEQARTLAAARVLRTCFDQGPLDAELAIRAIELLDDAGRKEDAAAIADRAIQAAPHDPRLHAYAGTLHLQLGEFTRAREHYLFALEHGPEACEWHVPYGLANTQRYHDAQHPDLALFRDCLQREGLSERARSTLLFALGKAHDDAGEYAQAAAYFRQANAIGRALTKWSRKDWRRAVEARLSSRPTARRPAHDDGFVPILIVGMPRSGTTLLAELLSRHPQVCNRGESPWIARLAERPGLSGECEPAALAQAASEYAGQLRQDDAPEARWFIDKQPLNFRYVGLVMAMFPNARIIHCTRNPRDNALSLWTQSFHEEVQGYSHDFADIATVMRDSGRLAALWRKLHGDAILEVRYEELVRASAETLGSISAWLGLPEPGSAEVAQKKTAIGTASIWQARQPLYTSSIGRWRNYSGLLPELLQFRDEP
jgi:tetratricopeptide (TPR) repeat protein